MKRFIKGIGLALCLTSFSIFALGSGSDSNSSTEKIEVDANGSADSTNDSSSSTSASTTTTTEKKEMSYEISDTSFEYYTNSIGTVEYYGIVEITNTGDTCIYMDNCTFDLEDNEGHLLQSESFISKAPDIIAPGEKGYFYNGLGSNTVKDGVSFDNGVKLVPQLKLTEAKGEPKDFPVSDVTVSEGNYGYINVMGRVENDTDEEIGYLYINIIFYGADGKVIAIDGTSITEVAAGNKGSFDTTCYFSNNNLKFSDIAETKIYARDDYYQW